MKRTLWLVAALCAAGCGSSTTKSGTNTSSSSTGSSAANGSGNGAGTIGGATSATGGSTASASSGGASGASSASGSSGGSGGSTTGDCYGRGEFVGAGNEGLCCSGVVDASGYCTDATSTGTTGSGTTGTSGTSGTPTGTTTGGICPNNVPNLLTGQGANGGACNTNPNAAACPKGYHCDTGECVLNTSSTLQVTLSFDNIEDFDLHLMEPLGDGGYCEIYYGNAGTDPDAGPINFPFDAGFDCSSLPPGFCNDAGSFQPPGSGPGCPAGWLDLDTNAACGGNNSNGGAHPDGVNIENILFSSSQQPPPGHYIVRVDYWQNCDDATCTNGQDQSACGGGHPSSDLSVQVRMPSGAINQYCPAISLAGQGPNDHGDNGNAFADGAGPGAGFFVTSFDIP